MLYAYKHKKGRMDGHSACYRISAGMPTYLEMPQKVIQAQEYQHNRYGRYFIINYVNNCIQHNYS
jgi:hypothetical protein